MCMSKHVSITLDDDLYDIIKSRQEEIIKSEQRTCTFSKAINIVLSESFKH